jgi:hypothetical protein
MTGATVGDAGRGDWLEAWERGPGIGGGELRTGRRSAAEPLRAFDLVPNRAFFTHKNRFEL